jgi:predicted permease
VSAYFLPTFYAVLELIVLMAIGFLVRRSGKWGEKFFAGLSRLVVRVALPLYFVVRVSRTDLSEFRSLLIMPVVSVGVVGLGLVLSLVVFRFLRYRGSDRRAGLAMASFGNSGYMPLTMVEIVSLSLPVIAERYGTELPLVLIAAYLFVQSPLLWSIGHYIITKSDDTDHRLKVRDLLSPPLIGIIIGMIIALSGLNTVIDDPSLPLRPIFQALERLAGITLPLALVNLGGLIGNLEISRDNLRRLLGITAAVSVVRFLLLPAAFFGLYFGVLRGSGVAPAVIFVIFLEMHTPPATNLSLMAGQAGVNEHHTAATLLVTYVLYLVLMPVYLAAFLSIAG